MTRQDLIGFQRRQRWIVLAVLVLLLVGVGLVATGALARIVPAWSVHSTIPWLGGLALVTLAAIPIGSAAASPKCPHCRKSLTGRLLQIAIASGNCGHCGKSIED